jgi:hypothetical protein
VAVVEIVEFEQVVQGIEANALAATKNPSLRRGSIFHFKVMYTHAFETSSAIGPLGLRDMENSTWSPANKFLKPFPVIDW